MIEFELLERDGLARLGRFTTPHGVIETPALLPVVHPDRERQPIPPEVMRQEFGAKAIITSSYILWRSPVLRPRAEVEGVHKIVGFDGPIMTDSGAFQQHAYGDVEVGADEILAFQNLIGTDIATVLDLFTEPSTEEAAASAATEETAVRARRAREARPGLLAVPVQGGLHPAVRLRSAELASELGDVLAVGGVVPLLEQYRFPELARLLIAARPGLAPQLPVHLFGAGHPVSFAFAALFGVDLFDSSSYLKFARRDALMFPWGTVDAAGIREAMCACWLCADLPLPEVMRRPAEERVVHFARHNLLTCLTEVARVRQAIRDGQLWELAEERAAAHPALAAGLLQAVRGARWFVPSEPESRPGFRATLPSATLRPAVIRFLARLGAWQAGREPNVPHRRMALVPSSLARLPAFDLDGRPIRYGVPTPVGPVPLELSELYPIGCWNGPDSYATGEPRSAPREAEETERLPLRGDELVLWTERHLGAILEWQYGAPASAEILAEHPDVVRSRRTGRVRGIVKDGAVWFTVGTDGLPYPTWQGARRLHPLLELPRRRVLVDADAVPFVTEGRSLFSRFARPLDRALGPGSSAHLVDDSDRLLAVGRLLLAPHELGRFRRGVAAVVTAHARSPPPITEEPVEFPQEDVPPT
ncbi:MAG: tRNA guanosine(15) transglycosylase TgtA [Thermoplasmata archaeon]|nr:tRNA guanosine(15) transglycosylase TgtA [Thermoplasmata archaeon]